LLRVDDASQRVAAHALGEVDRDRRARHEGFGETHVPLVEARVGAELVVPRTVSGRYIADVTPSSRATRWSTSGSSTMALTRSVWPRSSTRPTLLVRG